MLRRITAVVIASLLISFLPATNGFAAVKAGATCSKVGQATLIAGKKYLCANAGKKLIWVLKKSTEKISLTPPVVVPPVVVPPVVVPPVVDVTAACKSPNGSGVRPDVAIGWPRLS